MFGKKFLFISFLIFCGFFTKAQTGLFNTQNGSFYIPDKDTLFIGGDLQNLDADPTKGFTNNGTIVLTGNLVNNDSLYNDRPTNVVPGSRFIFFGTATQTVSGSAFTSFFKFIINKTAGEVVINSNVYVKDTLNFISGKIRLNGKDLNMVYPTGVVLSSRNPFILNENTNNHFYGDSGFVVVNTVKDISKPDNLANMGLTIKETINGNLIVKRGHQKQVNAANGSIKKYFDVKSSIELTDSISLKYINSSDYAGLSIDINRLKIFVSPASDIDYVQLSSVNNPATFTGKGLAADLSLQDVNISQKQFRITLADIDCSNPPVSALVQDTIYICSGDSALLDAGNNVTIPNSSLNWRWSTNATTQSIWVEPTASYQTFSVRIKDVKGCITFDTVTIAPTAPSPVANFKHTNVCIGSLIQIKDTSSISSGTYVSYWELGDGTDTTTAVNNTIFTKNYSLPGTYHVRLTTTSNHGCVSEKTDSVYVFPQPTADFASAYNCQTGIMQFTDSSEANFGSILDWFWNLGEGATDTTSAVSPGKSYSTPGTYSVSLIVTTYQGCKDTSLQSVTVYPENQTLFSASNVCLGDTVNFLNSSVCNTGNCNYSWDFGDGTNSTLLNPTKNYSAFGVYNVKLKTLTATGCPDSLTMAIFVNPKPTALFTASSLNTCLGNYVYFSNTSSIVSGNLTYNWDLGNSNSATTINASENYLTAGTYTVNLTAVSDSGCSASFSTPVNIRSLPVAQYSVSAACQGEPTVFSSTSSGVGLVYNWNYGNANTSTANNPSYVYPVSGSYNTQLIVTDSYGCGDTSSQVALVKTIPAVNLGGTISTCGSSYILDAGNPGSNYLWQPGNFVTQSINVTQNGAYTLQVNGSNGCITYDTVNVFLNSAVKPDLGTDTTACGSITLNAGYPGNTYLWNSSQITQTINVTSPGTYIVMVTDQNNCQGSDTIIVGINPAASVSLGQDISQCSTGTPVTLNPATTATGFLWSTGSTGSALTVNQSGTYWVKVTDANNCSASDTVNVNLLASPFVNLGADITSCSNLLLDAQNTGNSFLWSTGSTSQTITASNTNTYWVAVTNSLGCISRDTINVTINAAINLFLGNDTSVCSNLSFVLDAGNPGAGYLWNNGQTTQTLTVGSSGTYGVTVTNGTCTATDYIAVTLTPAPVVELGSSVQYLCSNTPLTIGSSAQGNYNWQSNTGFTSSSQSINITNPGTYWLTVNNNGCIDTDTVTIISSPNSLQAYFLASTVDTVNKPVQFVDLSEPTPTSYLWNFGDGFYSTSANPVHTFLQAQNFNVTLQVSNGFCTSSITKTVTVVARKAQVPVQSSVYKLELLDFIMYPNPSSDNIQVRFLMNDIAPVRLYLYDITGRLVNYKNAGYLMEYNEFIDIRNLQNGIYFLRMTAETGKGLIDKSIKLIKVD